MLTAAEDRQIKIIELLRAENFVSLRMLSDQFETSAATVRRDLDELEAAGLLRRTHGGAVGINQVALDVSHEARAVSYLIEKQAIAKIAAGLIHDGDTVLLDAGTTSLEVAKQLSTKQKLTLITNSLDIIAELTRSNIKNLYTIGGEFTPTNRSFRGPLAEQFIHQFTVDKLILNVSSIELDRGVLCTSSPANARIQHSMIKISRRIIVVADHSKFTKSSLSVIADIEDVSAIITDQLAAPILTDLPENLRRKFIVAD